MPRPFMGLFGLRVQDLEFRVYGYYGLGFRVTCEGLVTEFSKGGLQGFVRGFCIFGERFMGEEDLYNRVL